METGGQRGSWFSQIGSDGPKFISMIRPFYLQLNQMYCLVHISIITLKCLDLLLADYIALLIGNSQSYWIRMTVNIAQRCLLFKAVELLSNELTYNDLDAMVWQSLYLKKLRHQRVCVCVFMQLMLLFVNGWRTSRKWKTKTWNYSAKWKIPKITQFRGWKMEKFCNRMIGRCQRDIFVAKITRW